MFIIKIFKFVGYNFQILIMNWNDLDFSDKGSWKRPCCFRVSSRKLCRPCWIGWPRLNQPWWRTNLCTGTSSPSTIWWKSTRSVRDDNYMYQIKVLLLNPYQDLTFIKQLVLIIWMSFISGFIKNWYCWVIYKMMINLLCGFICRHSSMNWGPAQTQWLLSEREPRKCWTNLNMTWHSSKLSLSSLPQCGIECVSWAWTSRRS